MFENVKELAIIFAHASPEALITFIAVAALISVGWIVYKFIELIKGAK